MLPPSSSRSVSTIVVRATDGVKISDNVGQQYSV